MTIRGKNHRSMSVNVIKQKHNELPVLNNIHLRKQIENTIHKEFKKLDYLMNSNDASK